MSEIHLYVVVLGCFRVLIGAAPIVAPRPAMRLLGVPPEHDNPTGRLMARLFGVRDIGLGVLAFLAVRHPGWLGFVSLFNAAHDVGDLFALGWPLLRRDGIDRTALSGLVAAVSGIAAWLVAWALV